MTATQDPAQPAAPGALPSEAEALDAYSRVVTQVAEALAPSVANLRVSRRGGGSGVVITPDGFMLTSAHVVESRRGRPRIRARSPTAARSTRASSGRTRCRTSRCCAPTTRIVDDVIQTDAALNPGNSGGALVDDMHRLLTADHIGRRTELTVMRDGGQRRLALTPRELS